MDSRRTGTVLVFLSRQGLCCGHSLSLPDLLLFLNTYVALGQGAAHWWVLDEPWTPAFWLFMAAGSIVLPPLFEELLIRGYVQTRLIEDFGCWGGILLTATLFTVSHGQYHNLSILSVGMMASLFLMSVVWGYYFYRTGSLIPVIVAHSLANVPVSGVGRDGPALTHGRNRSDRLEADRSLRSGFPRRVFARARCRRLAYIRNTMPFLAFKSQPTTGAVRTKLIGDMSD